MSILTVGQWVWVPTPSGADDRFRANQSGGAGDFQVHASNGHHAARENGLRALWEDRGTDDLYLDTLVTGDPQSIALGAEDSAGAYVRYAGIYRVRPWGESGLQPRIELRCRGAAPVGNTLGVMLLATLPEATPEAVVGQYATATTTSTTIVNLTATLTRFPVAQRAFSPRDPSTQAILEQGNAPCVALWVAAWCTSGTSAAKAALYGPTIYLRPPDPNV